MRLAQGEQAHDGKGSGSVRWGEAADEPAREDARPTEKQTDPQHGNRIGFTRECGVKLPPEIE
jgi:hypothetical protein